MTDLTQSTIADINQFYQDSKKTEGVVEALRIQQKIENDKKVDELQSAFLNIDRDTIERTLSENNWSVELALGPLCELEILKQKTEPENLKCAVELQVTPFVDENEIITVNFRITAGQSNNYDWVGLFKAGSTNKEYLTWQWRGNLDGDKSELKFNSPKEYGEYECRYMSKSSFTSVAISSIISVGPRITLIAKRNENKIDLKIIKQSGQEFRRSWAGIYEINTPDSNYLQHNWVQFDEGICNMSFDTPKLCKTYEIRYFPTGYKKAASSNLIEIEGTNSMYIEANDGKILVQTSLVTLDPAKEKSWVGLFKAGAESKQYITYQYIRKAANQVNFNLQPEHGIIYECRVFADRGYENQILTQQVPLNL